MFGKTFNPVSLCALMVLLELQVPVVALRCNGRADADNCGSENLPESFCDATTFSSSLNQKLSEYTQRACPSMCKTCITTTSTTTGQVNYVTEPTEAIEITPKQTIAIFGLSILPCIMVGLAYTYRKRRIPVSIMTKVKSTNIDAAVNRRLHAGAAGGPRESLLAPRQSKESKGVGLFSPGSDRRSWQSIASVSSVDSKSDGDDWAARVTKLGIDRPSFDFVKPSPKFSIDKYPVGASQNPFRKSTAVPLQGINGQRASIGTMLSPSSIIPPNRLGPATMMANNQQDNKKTRRTVSTLVDVTST